MSASIKPVVIIRGSPSRKHEFDDLGRDFETHYASSPQQYDDLIVALGDRAEAVVTNGSMGLSASQMAGLARLRLVLCRGVGVENVDVEQARSRSIVVTNGAGVNWFTVADQAMALLLGIVRDTVGMDRSSRTGDWSGARAVYRPALHGKTIGIAGLGRIGAGIMRRAAGFDMEIAYTSRTRKSDVECPYVSSVLELAQQSDFLMLCVPGGPETFHLVDAPVLKALGPNGYLVNVARGSVVDTAALVEALHTCAIAGAGLDVWEGEPEIPEPLAKAPRLLLSPHVGGLSPEAIAASNELIARNLISFFRGNSVVNQVA